MNNYLLLVDTYESETIDETALKTNNVSGMIIRLNDMEGGHHLDANFTTQWAETGNAGLLRVPYFVYNPWVDGQANYDWLVRYIPYEAGAVLLDTEVNYPNYPPSTYAAQVAIFCQLVSARWNYMIYTGEGKLPLLSSWPTNADYWWAQYPLSLYPPVAQRWTWDQVRAQVNSLDGPYNVDKVPGRFKMWQVTGDRLILPGSDKPIDVDVFPGTFDELRTWINEKPISSPDPIPDEHTQPFEGVDLYKVYRFNSNCHVAVIDTNGKRFLVTKFGYKKVSTVARELGAQLVINGGAYNGSHAIGLHSSEGRVYQPIIPYEPWVNLTVNNKPQINAYNSRENYRH